MLIESPTPSTKPNKAVCIEKSRKKNYYLHILAFCKYILEKYNFPISKGNIASSPFPPLGNAQFPAANIDDSVSLPKRESIEKLNTAVCDG